MSRKRLFNPKPLIYLITEGRTTAENFVAEKRKILSLVEIAAAAKISLVQIREKNLPARLVFQLVSEAVGVAERTETKILVNDRADIALAARAGGVHLTAYSLAVETVRRSFPPDFIVGASVHSVEEAVIAQLQTADFITFSPIFPTPDKERYGAPQGLEKLRRVCERLKSFPVIALGGIDQSNYKSVLAAGASGFAAIRFLNDAENLRKSAADFSAPWRRQ